MMLAHTRALPPPPRLRRYIDFAWKEWANPEEGGVAKPSLVMGL